jgi:hypothetical protein
MCSSRPPPSKKVLVEAMILSYEPRKGVTPLPTPIARFTLSSLRRVFQVLASRLPAPFLLLPWLDRLHYANHNECPEFYVDVQ